MDKIRCLDLGCGEQPQKINRNVDEYYGLDIIDTTNPNVEKCDLFVESIPFESDYFDYVTAFDFIEHVPRVLYYKEKLVHPFIHVMNESYRVLKKEGIMIISVPSINSENNFFWNDPTHVNPITSDVFNTYFCTTPKEYKTPLHPWAKNYGFVGNFKILSCEEKQLKDFIGIKAYQININLQKI